MKLNSQTVYLPVSSEDQVCKAFGLVKPSDKSFVQFVCEKQMFAFTPEQLNQLLSDVIKQTLETAGNVVDNEIEKDFLMRIDSELKKKVQEKAKSLGLSVSAYIRTLLIEEVNNE